MRVSKRGVLKFSTDSRIVSRLHSQAAYMRYLNDTDRLPICPSILRTTPRGYVMSWCQTVHAKFDGVTEKQFYSLLDAMVQRLQWSVWSQTPRFRDTESWSWHLAKNIGDTTEKFEHKLKSGMRKRMLNHVRELADITSLPQTRIHGDATLDNVLFTRHDDGSSLMLVSDPLPPDQRIPDARAVDLGKILQSAMGWERLKYGATWPKIDQTKASAVILEKISSDDEKVAALTWCAIHLVRILPYAAGNMGLSAGVVNLLASTLHHIKALRGVVMI